jgi:hypothetical protein
LAFIYPHVDQQSRTVTVRFELSNPGHMLRPGMTANVTLLVPPSRVPVLSQAAESDPYRTSQFAAGRVLAVPESSVIDTGSQKIVYRESLPGVYEGVQVVLGPKMIGPENVVFYPLVIGLDAGERVVTSGSFLVDAETRLNPAAGSIYFGGSGGGTKTGGGVITVRPSTPENEDAKLQAALKKLSPDDRRLAEQQRFCPILETSRLGSMGVPIKVVLEGRSVFLCCPGCESAAKDDVQGTLNKVETLRSGKPPVSPAPSKPLSNQKTDSKIQVALSKLSVADRRLVEEQRNCPILPKNLLGSMGTPVKLMLDGQPVFLCCSGCEKAAKAHSAETLHKVAAFKKKSPAEPQSTDRDHEPDPEIRAALNKLSPSDRTRAVAQRFCPVIDDSRLGSMGVPLKVMIDGHPVFLCCEGCEDAAREKPQATLAKVRQLLNSTKSNSGEETR